jgi:hypothetical protein
MQFDKWQIQFLNGRSVKIWNRKFTGASNRKQSQRKPRNSEFLYSVIGLRGFDNKGRDSLNVMHVKFNVL